jgi:hypothetical protein
VVGEPVPILYVQMDRTGMPVVKARRTANRPTRGKSSWDLCSPQTTWDNEGFAIRDPDSTTYVGAIETAEEFDKRIYKRIWNDAEQHFPGAVQIVDLYHSSQHLWELVRKLHPNDAVAQKSLGESTLPSDPKSSRRFASKPITSRGMPSACVT